MLSTPRFCSTSREIFVLGGFWEDYVFHFCSTSNGKWGSGTLTLSSGPRFCSTSRVIFVLGGFGDLTLFIVAARLVENRVPRTLRFIQDAIFAPRLV